MYSPTHWEVEKVLASSVAMDSCWGHDWRWIFEHDGTGGADRVGSRRRGRASFGAARQCARAAGSGDELLASRGGTFVRRRYGSHMVPALPGRRDRGAGRVRLRGRQLSSEPRAAGVAEILGRRDAAAHDTPCRGVDRTGVRHRLSEPVRADCAASSFGDGAPQAAIGVAKARRDQAEGLHRGL